MYLIWGDLITADEFHAVCPLLHNKYKVIEIIGLRHVDFHCDSPFITLSAGPLSQKM